MSPGGVVQPWEVLEVDLTSIGTTSFEKNEYLMVVVDKASKFALGLPLSLTQVDGIARQLLQPCLRFGVPRFVLCKGGVQVSATVI